MAALRVLLAASALALPLWVAATAPARACTPPVAPGPSLEELVAQADVILLGVPTHIRLINPLPEPTPLSPPAVDKRSTFVGPGFAVVAVHEYLKGSGPADLEVFQPEILARYSPPDPPVLVPYVSTSCDYVLSLDEEHLLFLNRRNDGRLEIGTFSGSARIHALGNEADARLQEIRRIVAGAQPTSTVAIGPFGTGSPSDATRRLPIVILSLMGGALLVSSFAMAVRSRY